MIDGHVGCHQPIRRLEKMIDRWEGQFVPWDAQHITTPDVRDSMGGAADFKGAKQDSRAE